MAIVTAEEMAASLLFLSNLPNTARPELRMSLNNDHSVKEPDDRFHADVAKLDRDRIKPWWEGLRVTHR